MRIIAGKYKGRVLLDAASGNTHPMSEKMRGALFNALGDIEGLTMLDAYSGTGLIAIEALSRGAQHVTAIDSDTASFKCITKNAQTVQAKAELTVVCANITTWLNNNNQARFHIIVADPPYNSVNEPAIVLLAEHLEPGGVLVLSLPNGYAELTVPGLQLIKSKAYAGGSLRFYKATKTAL